MADPWDQFSDAKVIGRRAADMWDQFSDAKPVAAPKGTVYDLYPQDLENPMGMAATAGASDAQMGDIVQKTLGDRFIGREKTPDGYEVFTVRGPDGQEQRTYLNQPGFDSQDLVRSVRGALPYMVTGGAAGVAGRGLGLLANSAMQGGVAAATSVAGDAGQSLMGSEQGVEGGKALAAGAFGAAGPVVGKALGAAYQRFVAEPRFFDRATNTLTAEGRAAAQQMGLDPQTMMAEAQRTFAKSYAADPQAAAQLVDSGRLNFNVPVTKGQMSKDPQQLMVEKSLRHGIQGETAKNVITSLDNEQQTRIAEAVRQTLPQKFVSDPAGSVMPQNWQTAAKSTFQNEPIAPEFWGANLQDTMRGVKGKADALESAAWDGVGVLRATPQALNNLPTAVKAALPFEPDSVLHPSTWRMLEKLDGFVKGKPQSAGLDILGPNNTGDLDTFRRQLLSASQSATNTADRTLAGQLYRGFNDWILDSAQQQLLLGNADDAARLVSARDVTKTSREIFTPAVKGRATPGARVIEQVMQQDTPEKIIDVLFSSPKAGTKDGTVEAILQMKRAVMSYGDKPAAADLWTSLKVAYWSKIVQGKDGKVLSPTVMLNNLNAAFNNQPTVVQTLFSASDQQMIMRLRNTLEQVAYKDPNPSGTATGVAVLTKQLLSKFMSAFGPVGQAAIEFSGVPRAWGTAVARRAVAQTAPAVPAQGVNLGPATAGAGSAIARQKMQ